MSLLALLSYDTVPLRSNLMGAVTDSALRMATKVKKVLLRPIMRGVKQVLL